MLLFTHHKIYINVKNELFKVKESIKKIDTYYALVKIGEIETAVLDFFNEGEDNFHEVTNLLRELSIDIAMHNISNIDNYIEELIPLLPDKVLPVSIQEGYAYYALYPEQYEFAALKYLRLFKHDSFVIGIRNIGASLSSVVAATLLVNDINIKSITVRPKGEWNNRHIILSYSMKKFILENNKNNFLIVDEGPGKTGTSISGVVEYLHNIGIDYNQIFIFPSYKPELNALDACWSKCRIIVEHFLIEDLFEDFTYLTPINGNTIFDKLKYKLQESKKTFFVKFVGLGEYGIIAFNRAILFYNNQLSPQPLSLKNGFIYFEYINEFLTKEDLSDDFILFASSYYSFIYKKLKANPSHSLEELDEIIKVNLKVDIDRVFTDQESVQNDDSPGINSFCFIDGKYFKTGNSNYPLRHVLPGNVDIHYDIAGFILENSLSETQIKLFLNNLIFNYQSDKLSYYSKLFSAIKKAKLSFI